MLFFFELFLFVLVLLTLALGEFISRGMALTLWLVVASFTLVGYVFARQSLRGIIAREAETAGSLRAERLADDAPLAPAPDGEAGAEVPAPLDAKWARTLLYNWRRANVLLILGAFVVGGWYWLGLQG